MGDEDRLEEEKPDRTMPVGVGLKESEIDALDKIAATLDVARNALIRFAVRFWLAELKAGNPKAKPQTIEPRHRVPRKRIKM